MAERTAAKNADALLYESDYYAWVQRQAELLRQRRLVDLDLENLIEEVEDLGKSERYSVESFAETIIEHLLKLAYSSAREPRLAWQWTVAKRRLNLEKKLSPTLLNHVRATLPARYRDARRLAAFGLRQDGVDPECLPAECPYLLEQILDPDWFPDNVHGLKDEEVS
jgi:Domain of unknown function DUF29